MPSRDKYYAMILLRMDAKRYTLVNYVYMLVKFAVGYVPVVLWFGMGAGLEMWQCLLLAAFAVGTKLTVMRHGLRQYRKKGTALDSRTGDVAMPSARGFCSRYKAYGDAARSAPIQKKRDGA